VGLLFQFLIGGLTGHLPPYDSPQRPSMESLPMHNGSTSDPQTLMRLKILGHFCAFRGWFGFLAAVNGLGRL
jgi:hypothetical protein